jgi:hypothetical protein
VHANQGHFLCLCAHLSRNLATNRCTHEATMIKSNQECLLSVANKSVHSASIDISSLQNQSLSPRYRARKLLIGSGHEEQRFFKAQNSHFEGESSSRTSEYGECFTLSAHRRLTLVEYGRYIQQDVRSFARRQLSAFDSSAEMAQPPMRSFSIFQLATVMLCFAHGVEACAVRGAS